MSDTTRHDGADNGNAGDREPDAALGSTTGASADASDGIVEGAAPSTASETPSGPACDNAIRPKLRNVDAQLVEHDGQPVLHLTDPLALSDSTVAVPHILGPLLALLDGTRDIAQVDAAFEMRYGIRIGLEPIEGLVGALDDLYLLDNARSERARVEALASYRDADHRAPFLAGQSYPADPGALRALLDGNLAAVADEAAADAGPASANVAVRMPRGVVSPHIDFMRGGLTYARVWRRAAEAARSAELAIVIGTDHFGQSGSITLSHAPYATPFGVLPQPKDALRSLADAVGEEDAFSGELNHRTEHSVELSAVWLHHMRGGEPIDTVPVLVGSFDEQVENGASPQQPARFGRFVEAIAELASSRRTLLVASADLSHVGPAFGGEPLDAIGRERLVASDRKLVDRVSAGDADGFLSALRRGGDKTNVCGTGPIYLMLQALGETRGHEVDYQLCPADDADTSVVSVCGVLLE